MRAKTERELEERINDTTVAHIKRVVCEYFCLPSINMNRTPRVVKARQIAMYFSRELVGRSYGEISPHFGNRDDTTIMYGIRKIRRLIRFDWELAYDVAHLEQLI
jgi:chromosomal replication initiator protein